MLFNRPMMPGAPRPPSFLTFILFLIFGLYLVNFPIGLIPIPAAVLQFDKWIVFVGGVLLLVSAASHLGRITRGY